MFDSGYVNTVMTSRHMPQNCFPFQAYNALALPCYGYAKGELFTLPILLCKHAYHIPILAPYCMFAKKNRHKSYFIKEMYAFCLHLRNRKHFPCFDTVMETRVEVWENEKLQSVEK